jgi:integrase
VVERATQLRSEGLTLRATAERLRDELPEAGHITKGTLASMLRPAQEPAKLSPRQRPGLDKRTVNYVRTIIHRAFKDAVRLGRLARNPADAANPPKGGQKRNGIHTWDAPTLRSFLAESARDNERLHPLFVLLATTGVRRGEALGLRWSDLDLDAGRLRVVQTVIQIRSEVLINEPKTSAGRRPIAIDKPTVAVLRERRKRMLEERRLIGPGPRTRHPPESRTRALRPLDRLDHIGHVQPRWAYVARPIDAGNRRCNLARKERVLDESR